MPNHRHFLLATTAAIAVTVVAPQSVAAAAGKPLTVTVGSTSVTEGHTATIPVTMSGGNGRAVTVQWSAGSLTGTFSGKNGTYRVQVPTADDALVNGTRSIPVKACVTSGSVHPCGTGAVTVLDNDVATPPATLKIVADSPIVKESDGKATVHGTVDGVTGPVQLTWATNNNGTATKGVDYPALLSGGITVTSPGTFSFSFPIINDGDAEPSETIGFDVCSNDKAACSAGFVTVQDDDTAPLPPDPGMVDPGPAPTPPATGYVVSPTFNGLAAIASNFDEAPEYAQSVVPASAAPDTLGAFRFLCLPGQVLPDDPIVYPGQPGKSHLHQFYGNTGADASSTYESLRTTGQSTCMSPLNRSAYWMPAMLDGKGNVVRPDYVQVYYKRYPGTAWQCNDLRVGKACVQQPNGIRWIRGRDMLNLSAPATGSPHFLCDNNTGEFDNLADALKVCTPGHHVLAGIAGPDCWDGKYLDTPDHRSHISSMVDTHLGFPGCPADHPYIIPEFNFASAWSIPADGDTSGWHLSCDGMLPNEPSGRCMHIDLFDAWSQPTKDVWTELGCIAKLLNCSSGILGDGRALRQTWPFSWTPTPRLIPLTQVPWKVPTP